MISHPDLDENPLPPSFYFLIFLSITSPSGKTLPTWYENFFLLICLYLFPQTVPSAPASAADPGSAAAAAAPARAAPVETASACPDPSATGKRRRSMFDIRQKN